jgi:hypothetical protein
MAERLVPALEVVVSRVECKRNTGLASPMQRGFCVWLGYLAFTRQQRAVTSGERAQPLREAI